MINNPHTKLHKLFLATVAINGVIAILDIGAGFFFISQSIVYPFLATLIAQGGIVGRLADFIVSMSGRVQAIGAFYFFSHGIVKLFLVWGLWKEKLWAYPVAIAFLTLFSVYQIYELLLHYSGILFAFLIFNTVVIFLVIKEYRYVVSITRPLPTTH